MTTYQVTLWQGMKCFVRVMGGVFLASTQWAWGQSIEVKTAVVLSEPALISAVRCSGDGTCVYVAHSLMDHERWTREKGHECSLSSLRVETGGLSWFLSTGTSHGVVATVRALAGETAVTEMRCAHAAYLLPTAWLEALECTTTKEGGEAIEHESMLTCMRMLQVVHAAVSEGGTTDVKSRVVEAWARSASGRGWCRVVRGILVAHGAPAWLEVALRDDVGVGEERIPTTSSYTSGSASASDATPEEYEEVAPETLFACPTFLLSDCLQEAGVFSLARRGITTLGEEAARITDLLEPLVRDRIKVLDLSGNALTCLDNAGAFFASFPSLEVIIIDSNPFLTHMPVTPFLDARRLKSVSARHCSIATIDADLLHRLGGLESLILSHNVITHVPETPHASVIKIVDLAYNKLTSLPDFSLATHLEFLDVSHNLIRSCLPGLLPQGTHGVSLSFFLCSHNAIEEIPVDFLRGFTRGVVDMRENPVWAGTQDAALDAEDFHTLSELARDQGAVLASTVRRALADDVRTKLCAYLLATQKLKAAIIERELMRHRPVGVIQTKAIDIGMWFYQHSGWLLLGVTLLTGGVGAGVGAIFHKIARDVVMQQAKRALIGAGIGVGIGAVASLWGYHAFLKDEYFYCDRGTGPVYMTTPLKKLYVGMGRIVAFLSVLKQYLVAFKTGLYWLSHYDELAARPDRVDHIMRELERALHSGVEVVLSRVDDATTLALLHDLLGENPLEEAKQYAAPGVIAASLLDSQDFATSDATYPYLGITSLTLIRTAVSECATAARIVRALLVNRYTGSETHRGACSLISTAEHFAVTLATIKDRIIVPLIVQMREQGHTTFEWYHELCHCQVLVERTREFLAELEHDRTLFERVRGV